MGLVQSRYDKDTKIEAPRKNGRIWMAEVEPTLRAWLSFQRHQIVIKLCYIASPWYECNKIQFWWLYSGSLRLAPALKKYSFSTHSVSVAVYARCTLTSTHVLTWRSQPKELFNLAVTRGWSCSAGTIEIVLHQTPTTALDPKDRCKCGKCGFSNVINAHATLWVHFTHLYFKHNTIMSSGSVAPVLTL